MNKKTIMVIDDNPANLKLTGDLLSFEGFDVYRCEDAEAAVESLKIVIPGLILVDVALPGMDGLQLTRILKASDRTKQIKIVALTAFAMKGDKEKALEAGCDGYITKPINTRTFIAELLEHLQEKNENI